LPANIVSAGLNGVNAESGEQDSTNNTYL